MKKFVNFMTVALFLLICAFPVYGLFFPGASDDTGENRALAAWPDTFDPVGIEDWFNDHFAFRGTMTSLYNRLSAQTGVRIVNNVAIGKDGWLFYTNDGSLADMKREIHYTDEERKDICDAQQQAKDYLEAQGISYYLVIAPDKHTVYPEFLPDSLQGYVGESRFDGLLQALTTQTDVPVIDTRQAVIDEKVNHTVFYKTDTHWNEYGAFAGYTQIINRIAQDFPNVRIITRDDCTVTENPDWQKGDMADFIGQADVLRDTDVIFTVKDSNLVRLETKYPETSQDPERDIIQLVNPDHPELPSAVVFRDSFCRMLYPMLADSFSKVTFVWTTSVLDYVVQGEKPDLVIMEYVERYSGQAVNGVLGQEEKLVDYESGDVPLPEHMALIRANIDSYDGSRPFVIMNGWTFIPTRDALRGEKHIALKNGDEVVYGSVSTSPRPDVTAYFASTLSDLNLDLSGFTAYFDKSRLHTGTWELIMIIDDGAGSAGWVEMGKKVTIE